MKLVILGGGGVRAPLLIPALIRRAVALGLQEVWLMDTDRDKLSLIGRLCDTLARRQNATFQVFLTTDARAALHHADHIITAIRPGCERGRATDERIAFRHGILGQETTGAGGFAMAMRSLPAILDYARLAAETAPRARIYNFTNPAGLVAQGLYDAGFRNVIGICDSANGAQHAASRYLGVPLARVRHEVYGLNHLSWTRSVRLDADDHSGEEVLPALLADPHFIQSTHMALFHPAVRALQGTFLNEYLHYFYHRDEALQALLAKSETRGEEVLRLTTELLSQLRQIDPAAHPDEALDAYHALMGQRSAGYMAHARHGEARPDMRADDDEGYAGVALGCIQALTTGAPVYTGLNVANNGAIAGFADDDVVEVSCRVDSTGIHPLPIGAVPESQYVLMRTIKRYERLAAQAILQRSKLLAVEALATHPLVGSYPLAVQLVDEFITAHHDTVGDWH